MDKTAFIPGAGGLSMTKSIIIAIDGPSASGKGTVARRLAAHFDFAWLDTGILYRAVALTLRREGKDVTDETAAAAVAQKLDAAQIVVLAVDPDLRSEANSAATSKVAAMPSVRAALLKFQHDFMAKPPGGKRGAVLDGRDIGTVIAPTAPVKIYVTASLEARANRRFKELQGRGENVTEAAVLADMKDRDARDQGRTTAPAKPADDAVLLDNTRMTADEAFAAALVIVQDKWK